MDARAKMADVCKIDEKRDRLPYCQCFEDFVGADCKLVSKTVSLNEPVEIQLFKGTSTLFRVNVAQIEQLKL